MITSSKRFGILVASATIGLGGAVAVFTGVASATTDPALPEPVVSTAVPTAPAVPGTKFDQTDVGDHDDGLIGNNDQNDVGNHDDGQIGNNDEGN